MPLDKIETWPLIGRQLRYSALSRNRSSIKQARSRSASKVEVEGGARFKEFWAKCNSDKIESTSMDVGVLGLELSSEQRSQGFGVRKKSRAVELWSS